MQFLPRHLGVTIALVVSLGLAGLSAAHAGPFEDALGGFTSDSSSDTADSIDPLAATGDPRAATVIEALQDQRLMFSAEEKKVLFRTQAASSRMPLLARL